MPNQSQAQPLPSQVQSIIRTIVPYVVGLLCALATNAQIDLPIDATSEVVTALVTFGVGSVYYILARLVEEHIAPRWGALMLGSNCHPAYSKDTPAPAE